MNFAVLDEKSKNLVFDQKMCTSATFQRSRRKKKEILLPEFDYVIRYTNPHNINI